MVVGSVLRGTGMLVTLGLVIFVDRGPRFFVRNEDGVSGPLLVEKGRLDEAFKNTFSITWRRCIKRC